EAVEIAKTTESADAAPKRLMLAGIRRSSGLSHAIPLARRPMAKVRQAVRAAGRGDHRISCPVKYFPPAGQASRKKLHNEQRIAAGEKRAQTSNRSRSTRFRVILPTT